MSPGLTIDHLTHVLVLILYLSMPTILVASVVGLIVSLLQALTQIQEQTLPFAVKLIAVSATLSATAAFTGNELVSYTVNIFDGISHNVR